jgi:thioredoxin 1
MQPSQTAALIDVSCPSCGEVYHVREENLGKNLKCRRCEHVFELRGSQGQAGMASEAVSGHPVTVTDADFARTVLQSAQPVLVDFWAPWCAPCRALAPALEQLAAEYAGRVTIAKLNTDDNQRTMAQAGVQGLPTLVLYRGGKEVDRLVGLRPKPHIKQALDRALS